MIKRRPSAADSVREIEAHHAARRAKGKPISRGALERLDRLRAEAVPRHPVALLVKEPAPNSERHAIAHVEHRSSRRSRVLLLSQLVALAALGDHR